MLSGCDGGAAEVVCPLLPPGGLSWMGNGASLTLGAEPAAVSGELSPGGLVTHAFVAAAGQRVKASVALDAGRAVAILYGPRDERGGYPHCRAIASAGADRQGASVTTEVESTGEYLAVFGAVPGDAAARYDATVACEGSSCALEPACPTLEMRGCPDIRCDGELALDETGCATCVCDPTTQCDPQRAAGPGGSCVLPACDCGTQPDQPICGSDGRTWPSTCHARCAQVTPIAGDACEIACPALQECVSPCFGARRIAADGCPTCECLPDFAPDAASCEACPDAVAPVCGDDGVTHLNRCRARCAGARILYPGACDADCRAAPAGCELDCPWGLRLQRDGDECLACSCAPSPPTGCETAGAPVCVTLPGLAEPTTVGSACLALHLGAEDGDWGPCGLACETSDECPEGARCQRSGLMSGRCLLDAPPCGCSALLEPICGDDGDTWPNICAAACAGSGAVHPGPCCEPAPACPDSERGVVDARGCVVGCAPASDAAPGCAASAATQQACTIDGAPVDGSACRAHLDGLAAWPQWCR